MINAPDLLAIRDLRGFAAANGWTYDVVGNPPPLYTGEVGKLMTGMSYDRINGPGWETGRLIVGGSAPAVMPIGRPLTPADYGIPDGVGLGYLAITLPRNLPQMLLDGVSNGIHPWIGAFAQPAKGQQYSLEGDFDKHFHLYAPKGYERDALYVFAPDLMALLIDETGEFDVEIRDNHAFVYRIGGFNLADPATWERFDRIRATFGAKALRQTRMYQDSRSEADNEVAAGGRRLKTRASRGMKIAIAIGIAVVALFVLPDVIFFAVFVWLAATQQPGN